MLGVGSGRPPAGPAPGLAPRPAGLPRSRGPTGGGRRWPSPSPAASLVGSARCRRQGRPAPAEALDPGHRAFFQHTQLASNKHQKGRSVNRVPRCSSPTGGAAGGREGRVGTRVGARRGRGGEMGAGRCPRTLSPRSEARLKLPTKSRPVPGEGNPAPPNQLHCGPVPCLGAALALSKPQTHPEPRSPGESPSRQVQPAGT